MEETPRLFQMGGALQVEKLLSQAFPQPCTHPANSTPSKVELCPLPIPLRSKPWGPTPRKKKAALEGRGQGPMELVQKQAWLSPGWVALAVRGVQRAQDSDWGKVGDVSAGLFGKHGVNLAQNLGVWFWGPKPKLKKKGVSKNF